VIAEAIAALSPGAEWSLVGDDLATLEWFKGARPSDESITAKAAELQAEFDRTEYQRLRAPEYPPLTDLADAIFWQQQGDESKMEAYVAACEAVKAKYPKP